METNRLSELIEESIALELNASELYRVFSDALPEDREFWNQLYLEEKSHATLIRAARDSFVKRGKFPYDLVADSIEELKASNAKIKTLTAHYKASPPDLHEACKVAMELENESGEMHYSRFMKKDAQNTVEAVFQQLNRGDKEHAARIRAHCESIGVDS